jgi:hypothetical protein
MAPDAVGEPVDHFPAQGQLADRPQAQALAGALQRVLGHDRVRALAHVAERGGVGYRLIDVEQQQAPDLRGFLLASHLLGDEVLVRLRLALVLELFHVVAQGVDEIVGELPVALPGVAQQV